MHESRRNKYGDLLKLLSQLWTATNGVLYNPGRSRCLGKGAATLLRVLWLNSAIAEPILSDRVNAAESSQKQLCRGRTAIDDKFCASHE